MNDPKTQDWSALSELTQGRAFVVERVRLPDRDVAIEGAFEPPRLAQLSAEDQIFVAAFVRSHGSIKEMEQVFGVSYPTVKARLTRIAEALQFAGLEVQETTSPRPSRQAILAQLGQGEIGADEAVHLLEALR